MFYEVKVKVSRINERGEEKEVVEQYFLKDCITFTEAENKISEEIAADNVEFDVTAISRSKVIEIVNNRKDEEHFFKAKIVTTTFDDAGKPKEKCYYVLISANDVREANVVAEKYMSQGLDDMKLDGIVKTKFLNVL